MDNAKNDKYYFQKAIDDIDAIQKYVDQKTYEEFMADELLIDAVMFRLVQLIENVKEISDDFKQEHQEIAWRNVIGFRNRIVHEYGKTDYTVVYEVISKDLLELRELFIQYV